ncbi:MAG TPA: porin [Pseudomonadales bacterium]
MRTNFTGFVLAWAAASASAPALTATFETDALPPLSMEIGGYLQSDARFFDDSDVEQTDTFLIRRARANFDGSFGEDVTFRIGAEFGNGADGELYDAYVDWAAFPVGSLRVGKFKPPIGLELLQSNQRLWFTERSLVDNLVPSRDVGIVWQTSGRLEAAFGVFNQATDRLRESDDVDDRKTFVARLFGQPFGSGPLAGLGIGVAGSYGKADQAAAESTAQTTGRNTVFRYAPTALRDGTESRISPQFYWFLGPVGILGEYVVSELELTDGTTREEIANEAWQVAWSWVITGEENSWKGVKPDSTYRVGGSGWGAFELVARVSSIEFDDDLFPLFADPGSSVSEARAYEAGLNWYPNSALKVALNVARTEFDGGAGGGADREDEDLLLARLQIAF